MNERNRQAWQYILWDWNGTLLDDVALCLDILHVLCRQRGLPLVAIEEYRDKFTFPIVDYYKSVGFDLEREPFEGPANEWVAQYTSRVWNEAALFDGALDVLETLRRRGIPQAILSAHQHGALVEAVRHFGVAAYVDPILGLGDFYAASKVELGQVWLAHSRLEPGRVLLVGDTLHDYEVAQAMGIQCVLIAQGHQSRHRLEAPGVEVITQITQIPDWVRNG